MAVLVVVLVIAACGVFGWRSGVVRRLVELAGLIVSILAASRLASYIAPWLDLHTPLSPSAALVLAYVLIVAAGLVATWFAARGVQKALQLTILGWFDHVGGALCGVLLGALLASIGLIAVSQAPGGEVVRTTFNANPVGRVIYRAAPDIYLGARQLAGRKGDALWQDLMDRSRAAVNDAARERTNPTPP